MAKLFYKLTDEHGRSYGGMQWGPGVTNRARGKGKQECSPDFIHLYSDPLLAAFLNPIHANFDSPRLWEAKARIVASDHGLKLMTRMATTLREIPLPAVTIEQRIRFGLLCALSFYHEPSWVKWAQDWLTCKNRQEEAARAAAWVAEAAARTALAAADAPALAARAAARAARAARAATWTAEAAEAAALAAEATEAAARTAEAPIGERLISLAEQAMGEDKEGGGALDNAHD